MKLAYTRAMVRAALNGLLEGVPTVADPVFGIRVPESCPDVPSEVLQQRSTWADGAAYDAQAQKLAVMFSDNFRRFDADVSAEVRSDGPVIG
jgi:phosphoenolpyruvate carboxykinase (ATP)